MRGLQKFSRNWILTIGLVFDSWARQDKNVLPDRLDWNKQPLWKFNFLHILRITSSSGHENFCQSLERLFLVFQQSINILWILSPPLQTLLKWDFFGKDLSNHLLLPLFGVKNQSSKLLLLTLNVHSVLAEVSFH